MENGIQKQTDSSIKESCLKTSAFQNETDGYDVTSKPKILPTTAVDTMLQAIENAEKIFNTITSKDNSSASPQTKKHLFVKNEQSYEKRKVKKLRRVYTDTSPLTGPPLKYPRRPSNSVSTLV